MVDPVDPQPKRSSSDPSMDDVKIVYQYLDNVEGREHAEKKLSLLINDGYNIVGSSYSGYYGIWTLVKREITSRFIPREPESKTL